jgi:PEGA domain
VNTLIGLLLVLGAAGPASTTDQKHAAVLEFDLGPEVSGIDRIYFSDRARSALHDSGTNLFVMTRESTEVLLEANGKTMADCIGECEVEVGRKLGADYIISGRISRIGSRFAITMRLFATRNGELLSNAEARGKNADELQDTMDAALAKLFAPLGVSASAATVQVEDREATPTAATQPLRAERPHLPGTVDVHVHSTLGEDLAGASVTVDGHVVAIAPASLELGSGEHFIQVSKELYLPGKIRIVVKENEIQKATFELKPDFATVSITSQPDDTSITIDGMSAGRTPLNKLRIKTGQHTIVAEHPEYVSATLPLIAKPGGSLDLPVKLTPDFGPLSISSTPSEAEVFVDGKSVGRTPLGLERVKAGQHMLEVKGKPVSYFAWRKSIKVKRVTGIEPIEASLLRREADVLITSQPPGATVSIDGDKQGETSLKLRLLGGDHELRMTLGGYAPQKQVIHIMPPDPLHVQVKLSRGGSGPEHRFTLADLELQYRPEPANPSLLSDMKLVKHHELDGKGWEQVVLLGGISGVLAGALTAVAVCPSTPGSSGSSDLNCQGAGSYGAIAGVTVGAWLLSSVVWYYVDARVVTRAETDVDAVTINQQRMQAWAAQKSVVDVHNNGVDERLRVANANFEATGATHGGK